MEVSALSSPEDVNWSLPSSTHLKSSFLILLDLMDVDYCSFNRDIEADRCSDYQCVCVCECCHKEYC